jgi:hypothetical protein
VLYLDLEVEQLPAAKRRKFGGNGQARVLTAADFIEERQKSEADSKVKKPARPKRKAKAKSAAKSGGKEPKPEAKSKREVAPRTAKKAASLAESDDDEAADAPSESDTSSSGGSDADVLAAREAPRKAQLMLDDGTHVVALRCLSILAQSAVTVVQAIALSWSCLSRSAAGPSLRWLRSLRSSSPRCTLSRMPRTL